MGFLDINNARGFLVRVFGTRYLCVCLVMLCFAGCGYVPSSTYTQRLLGNQVFVKLNINLANPENSVELKDLVNKIVISRFQTRLSNQENADSIITININKIIDNPMAVSSDGFSSYYRVNTYVTYEYNDKKGTKKTFSINGYYDYSLSLDNPLTTYNNRDYALNQAFSQTLDKFIAQMSFEGSEGRR
ncbi:Probable lipoprotein Cj1090c [Helicobacter fennelliae]|uniref:Probable lipoprotein Cj1090c n=2 Tax=Helicobacter fennelliae TaxID=215 RepID=A0A2X3B8E4_9HELI|nr:LPS assembly lipoprotein LptE [Helicobacter fennelliae]GAD18188.1 putative lipoprotein [Helicobacter fennelliae MRY12-0050]SQB98017.1 Probable lipoprotein Cj1090c [Helicobacter fennelliae]STP06773.1 Probable lipoprotein Cj1090c [Helicobacter fennelliae]STQ83671.1 Probable lipoprotein Cj1090c [Helicobacter fennelliae]